MEWIFQPLEQGISLQFRWQHLAHLRNVQFLGATAVLVHVVGSTHELVSLDVKTDGQIIRQWRLQAFLQTKTK